MTRHLSCTRQHSSVPPQNRAHPTSQPLLPLSAGSRVQAPHAGLTDNQYSGARLPRNAETRPMIHSSPQCRTGAIAQRNSRPFHRGTGNGHTHWWTSRGPYELARPPEGLNAPTADLYLHANTHTNITQIWLKGMDAGWAPVDLGCDHPVIPGWRLYLRASGEPTWVGVRSLATMTSRARRRSENKDKNPLLPTSL